MGKLLIRKFIKDYKNFDDPGVRRSYAKLVGIVGIISNLFLSIIKIIIGWLSSSIAIIADGINNMTDASSSVITLVGFRLAALPEDDEHPYGHARIEYLTGVFISVIILIVGIGLLKSSVLKILHPTVQSFSWITILILVLSILIKLWQSFFYKYIGKSINSLAVIATSADSRNDVITTSVVLAGVIITKFTSLNLDGWLGCAVAIFIIVSGIQLILQTTSPLLGEAPDPDLVNQLIKLTKEHPGVYGIHDLMVHNYGPGKVFASMHVEVDGDGNIMEAHDMIDNIEKEVTDKLGIVFVIHMDPIKLHDPIIDMLKVEIAKSLRELDSVRSFHDLRIVPGTTHTNVVFDVVLEPKCQDKKDEITSHVESSLRAIDPKYNVVITFDMAYTHVTADEKDNDKNDTAKEKKGKDEKGK